MKGLSGSLFILYPVRRHVAGTRDPYQVSDVGAGFVLSWKGNTKLLVGRKNEDGELIQAISDSMCIAIPKSVYIQFQFGRSSDLEHPSLDHLDFSGLHRDRHTMNPNPFRKVCARLQCGVRFGVGFVLERACGEECRKCSGLAFQRQCRYFDFRPHYGVKLEKKCGIPVLKVTYPRPSRCLLN